MSKFTMHISAMVTIMDGDTFVVEANSAEEAEKKCREMFKLRMWEKHGYADYDEVEVVHYPENWRNGNVS